MYIAHRSDDGAVQTVAEHLCGVEQRCREWAIPPMKELAAAAGLLHDIGKYTALFQQRIEGNQHIQVEHAICGAKEVEKIFGGSMCVQLLQYVIAGHHTGLPDGGAKNDASDQPTLRGRLRRRTEDYSAYRNEIKPVCPSDAVFHFVLQGALDETELVERYAFLTKYIFSCLKDADFLDTEQFCRPDIQRGMRGDPVEALQRLCRRLERFTTDTPVKQERAKLQQQAAVGFDDAAEISVLQMPTGSGKTLCSLKLALEYAIRNNKERIIYIIPYTSIIEQTANIFTDIFGDSVEVLQHHSNYDYAEYEGNAATTADKIRRSCENWDARVIVTTNAQFFQSLYHYKGSRLRKLHHLANAVLVFDEVHMLPIDHLQPCLRGIGYITKYLNSHALLLSATMPDLVPWLQKYAPMAKVNDLIADKSGFSVFGNSRYQYIGQQSYEQIAMLAAEQESSLCVVNSRKAARELYQTVAGKKFHLSTFMTPVHRCAVLEKIRNCLNNHERITVVSTSLIEAGVDLDFAAVFRENTGIDSILQSGGRCNREGLREQATVFIFENEPIRNHELKLRAEITKSLLAEYEDPTTPTCIRDYYGRLFSFHRERIERNSIAKYHDQHFDAQHWLGDIPFRSYAEYFEYIHSESIAVVIPDTEEAAAHLQAAAYDPSVRRKLQRHCVSVYPYMLTDLLERGIVREQAGMFVLQSMDYYDPQVGLVDEISDVCFIQ